MERDATAENGRTRVLLCACGTQKVPVTKESDGSLLALLCPSCDRAALAVVTGLS